MLNYKMRTAINCPHFNITITKLYQLSISISKDSVYRFQYLESTLLDSTVNMTERLLKDSYFQYDADGEDE